MFALASRHGTAGAAPGRMVVSRACSHKPAFVTDSRLQPPGSRGEGVEMAGFAPAAVNR